MSDYWRTVDPLTPIFNRLYSDRFPLRFILGGGERDPVVQGRRPVS